MCGLHKGARDVGEKVDEVVKFARAKSTDIVACIGSHPGEIAVAFARRGQCASAYFEKTGGQLVLRLQDLEDDCIVQLCLSALGYRVSSTVFDLSAGILVAHRIDLDRKASSDDSLDIGGGATIPQAARKTVLLFGRLYHSSAFVGSTPGAAPFIQTSWS